MWACAGNGSSGGGSNGDANGSNGETNGSNGAANGSNGDANGSGSGRGSGTGKVTTHYLQSVLLVHCVQSMYCILASGVWRRCLCHQLQSCYDC